MKCLEGPPAALWRTPNELAADLERHLEDEPVSARPPTAAYRLHKAFRRNRAGFVGGIAVLMALFLGILFTSTQAIRARRAEALAMERRDDAEAIARFPDGRLPEPGSPSVQGIPSLWPRRCGRRRSGSTRIFPGCPAAGGPPVHLANTYGAVGCTARRRRCGNGFWSIAGNALGRKIRRRSRPRPHSSNRSSTPIGEGGPGDQEQTVEIRRRRAGPEARETLSALDLLASVLERSERPNDAVRSSRATAGNLTQDPGTGTSGHGGRYGESGGCLRFGGPTRRCPEPPDPDPGAAKKDLGAEHRFHPVRHGQPGLFVCDAGRLEEAIAMQDDLVRLRRKVLGPEHPDTLAAMHYRAYYEQLRDAHTAIPLHRRCSPSVERPWDPGW